MATVSRENIGLLNDKITITVEQTDYLPSFDKTIKNYSKQASIPGFRKGMVPVGVVKKMYGQAVFAEEVFRAVEKQMNDYLENENLDILARPLPLPENDASQLDMNTPASYNFSFEVGIKPTIHIDLSSAKVKRYNVEVDSENIDKEIEYRQNSFGKTINPETIETEEYNIHATFTEADAEGNEIEGGFKKENSFFSVKKFAEEVRKTLIGKKVEDTFVLQIGTAFEAGEKEKVLDLLELSSDGSTDEKYFIVHITKISFTEKAELNEELFKNSYPDKEIKTAEEFREAIKADLQEYWKEQAHHQMHDQIFHYLVDHATADFPEAFLKRWMETGGEHKKTAEQVNAEYPSFISSLKWSLILDKISKENNIDVTPDEIREAAKKQLFSYMRMNIPIMDDAPWINEYVERMVKDKKFVEDTFYKIQTTKVFEVAEQKISAEDTPISEADFIKILQEHHHH